ncbi:MAG: succinate dehydrogenase, cytochrome b556 subunit [Thiotrichaceae bacterium]
MSWDDKRPMSPHLQIYDLPLTAKLSVLHRGTGVVLFLGLIIMVWVLSAAASGAESWQNMHAFLSNGFVQLVLFGFTFSLYYHLCNGIKHLLWDIGKGFDDHQNIKKSIAIVAAPATLTLLTWLVALIA